MSRIPIRNCTRGMVVWLVSTYLLCLATFCPWGALWNGAQVTNLIMTVSLILWRMLVCPCCSVLFVCLFVCFVVVWPGCLFDCFFFICLHVFFLGAFDCCVFVLLLCVLLLADWCCVVLFVGVLVLENLIMKFSEF